MGTSRAFLFRFADQLNACLNSTGLGDLRWVRGAKKRVARLMARSLQGGPILTRVAGLRLYVSPAEAWPYLLHFEPYTTELFKQAVKPGARVLDIGAQFGYYSLLAGKAAGEKGAVYAFEPAPANFELLARNIQMNGYTDFIRPVPKAVGDKPGTATLFLYEGTDSHTMHPDPEASIKETAVECITIDDFLGGRPVDVIKIDIEGHEPYALEGMKRTITKSDPLTLLIEFSPDLLRRAGVEPGDLLRQLAGLGFHVRLIDEGERDLKPVTDYPLREAASGWYANLYCTKG